MTFPTASFSPNDDNVRYEQVDSLTVDIYVDGPGDTTVRPSPPSVKKMIEREREQIAERNARIRRDQEKLNARKSHQPAPDDPNLL